MVQQPAFSVEGILFPVNNFLLVKSIYMLKITSNKYT